MKYEVSFRAKIWYLRTWKSHVIFTTWHMKRLPFVWKTRGKFRGEFKWNGSSRWKFPGKKSNTFRDISFFPFLLKRPRFSVPFVWITSPGLHVQRKRKLYRYFVNGTTQFRSRFRCPKKYHYHWTEIYHRNFLANGKRSCSNVKRSPLLWLHNKWRLSQPKNIHVKK